MQTPLEGRFGLAVAIAVSGTIFGLLHFPNHPAQVVTMLPYYLAVSTLYSAVTSATNSILPALVLHTGGDVWSLGRLWLTGLPEWQIGSTSQPNSSTSDAHVLLPLIALVALSITTWWMCRQTAALRTAQARDARQIAKSNQLA
jgi:membrane protease YdiL (CAAX protease family)